MITESTPNALRSAISAGIGIFYLCRIKNAGLLKFSIDPHAHTVAGEGADKANAAITAKFCSGSRTCYFNSPTVLLALAISLLFSL